MNELSKITVIIPCYNMTKFIADAIKSVKFLTYKNFKCIIIDDYSTDNSVEIIRQNIKDDTRFRLIVNEKNHGVAYNRNLAIRETLTEFVLPLDGDDILEKTYILRAIDFFNNTPECTLYYGKWYMFGNSEAERLNRLYGNLQYTGYRNLLRSNSIHISAVYRKDDAIKCGLFDETMVGYEDWEFLIRLLYKEKLVAYDPTISLFYRKQDSSRDKSALKDIRTIYSYIVNKNKEIYNEY